MSLATCPQNHPALSVATVAELQVVSTGALVDGDMAFVQADGGWWRLSKSSTTSIASGAASGIIYNGDSALGVNAGRWFRLGYNGLAGNTVIAFQSADDATFWPVGGFATQLACTITTSSTRLWVDFSASGVTVALGVLVESTLYVTTGGGAATALTNAAYGGGGIGTMETTVALDTFNLSYKRLLTGLTAGVNTIEIYCDATGATAQCNADTNPIHHATLRVTEV